MTPTAPGKYEYRWRHRSTRWTPVEVVVADGQLWVDDPTVLSRSRLSTYANAEWRKQEETK